MTIACRPVVTLPKGGPETVPGTEIYIVSGLLLAALAVAELSWERGPGPSLWLKQQSQRAPQRLTGAAATRSLRNFRSSKVLLVAETFGRAPQLLRRLILDATIVSCKDVDATKKECGIITPVPWDHLNIPDLWDTR
jgi:hypothetical protein